MSVLAWHEATRLDAGEAARVAARLDLVGGAQIVLAVMPVLA